MAAIAVGFDRGGAGPALHRILSTRESIMSIHHVFRLVLSLALLALLAGCATGPTLRSKTDPGADFSQYRTFGWPEEFGTDRGGYSTFITEHFRAATRREMEARGYRYVEQDPDLVVNFYTRIQERTDTYARSTPAPMMGAGYYGYRFGLYTAWPVYATEVDTVHYQVGTANIDVVDARKRQLIWEGVAEGRLSEQVLRDPKPAIDNVVTELFLKFPGRAPAE